MTYIYCWAWGDFDSPWPPSPPYYKEHNMVYRTKSGVIDTIQWEGYREGVDDVRYVTTLLKKIEEAEKSKDAKIREVALEAKEYLEELKKGDVNHPKVDLDAVRLKMISYILKLSLGGER